MQVVLTEKKIVVDEKTEKVQALIAVIQEKTAIASVQQEQASIKQKFAEVGNDTFLSLFYFLFLHVYSLT